MPFSLRILIRGGLWAATAVAILLAGSAAAALTRPPSLTLSRATVSRTAHTVDVRLRICFSSGPRALFVVREQRTLTGVLKASRHWSPGGVEPSRIFPFACRENWRMNWLLEPGLRGPGTYAASIRVRDAYGRWTPPVAFSVSSR
jgi:hypothetical protein